MEHILDLSLLKKRPDAKQLRKYTMIISLIVIWILFGMMDKSGTFLSARNMSNLFRQMAVTALLAVGMFMVLVNLHIDLSMGSLVGLTGGVCALLMYNFNFPWWLAIAFTILLGAACGLWTGSWVNAGVPAFIASLSGLLAYRGAIIGLTHGSTIPVSDSFFKQIGTAYLPKTIGLIVGIIAVAILIYMTLKNRKNRIKYGFDVPSVTKESMLMCLYGALIISFVIIMNTYNGIPVPIIIVLMIGIIFTFITKKTKFGRQMYAIGGNREAAMLSGIDVKNRTMLIFITSGIMSALAGILFTARLGSASPDAGHSFELDAVASCVIGGTSLLGGEGYVFGAILGALVMASIDNGMSIMNTESFWQYIVKGVILVVAVYIDISSKKRK